MKLFRSPQPEMPRDFIQQALARHKPMKVKKPPKPMFHHYIETSESKKVHCYRGTCSCGWASHRTTSVRIWAEQDWETHHILAT